MLYVGIVLLLILGTLVILALSNKYLPKWFCDNFGHWHIAPIAQGFYGCSFNGACPRCGKKVLQDSQANWF